MRVRADTRTRWFSIRFSYHLKTESYFGFAGIFCSILEIILSIF